MENLNELNDENSERDLNDDEIEKLASAALSTVIPVKSQGAYELAYEIFKKWIQGKKVAKIDEKVMLTYFQVQAEQYAPTTMWCTYSKLRTMIYMNHEIDISKFIQLICFLKRKSKGYKPKKAKDFVRRDLERYITEASDKDHLMMKVALIVGVAGACRRCELTNLTLKNVEDMVDVIVVDVLDTKTYEDRQFVITEGNVPSINLLEIVRKYLSLRTTTKTDRFFVGYRAGKCSGQPCGINTIGGIPKKIAEFLGLPNPGLYTGHCFRVTSATLLVDSGACLLALKRHGKWKSTKVAEAYLQASVENKRKTANGILANDFSTSKHRALLTDISNRSESSNRPSTLQPSSAIASLPSTSTEKAVAIGSTHSVIDVVTSQEIRISRNETLEVTPTGKSNDINDFVNIAQNLQGNNNMFKCHINYNFYAK